MRYCYTQYPELIKIFDYLSSNHTILWEEFFFCYSIALLSKCLSWLAMSSMPLRRCAFLFLIRLNVIVLYMSVHNYLIQHFFVKINKDLVCFIFIVFLMNMPYYLDIYVFWYMYHYSKIFKLVLGFIGMHLTSKVLCIRISIRSDDSISTLVK